MDQTKKLTGITLYGGLAANAPRTLRMDVVAWAAAVAQAQGWDTVEATIMPALGDDVFRLPTWIAGEVSHG